MFIALQSELLQDLIQFNQWLQSNMKCNHNQTQPINLGHKFSGIIIIILSLFWVFQKLAKNTTIIIVIM